MSPSRPTAPATNAACPDRPVWWPGKPQAAGKTVAATEGCPKPFDLDLKNREIANLTWLGVLTAFVIALALVNWDVGKSLVGVLRALVQRPFLIFGALAMAWVIASIALLAHLDLWRWDNLKATIVWALTFAPVAVFEFHRAEKGPGFFRRAILEITAATVLVKFLVDEYSFTLWIEFLLVPFLILVVALHATAKAKPEYRTVERVAESVLALAGLAYVVNAIVQVLGDLRDFARYETLREFLTPILLSVAFLPIVYGLAVYAAYETAFGRLRVWIDNDELRAYARRRALLAFGLDLERLRRWSRDTALSRPADHAAVRTSILQVKRNAARAQASPPVFLDEGWSPHVAKDYLVSEGLVTGDYHASFEEWFAASPMVEWGDGVFPDNIAYYVEGDERVATCLKLKLHVNNPALDATTLARFLGLTATLLKAAAGDQVAAAGTAPLTRLEPGVFDLGPVQATLTHEPFTGAIPGYTLMLRLEPTRRRGGASA